MLEMAKIGKKKPLGTTSVLKRNGLTSYSMKWNQNGANLHKIYFFKYTTISRKACAGRQTTRVCNKHLEDIGNRYAWYAFSTSDWFKI